MVLLADRRAFIITPKDLAPEDGFVGLAAERAAERLRLALTEAQQARSLRFLLLAAALGSGHGDLRGAPAHGLLTRGPIADAAAEAHAAPRWHAKIGQTPMFDTSFLYPRCAACWGSSTGCWCCCSVTNG
jgi:hypothetical protein